CAAAKPCRPRPTASAEHPADSITIATTIVFIAFYSPFWRRDLRYAARFGLEVGASSCASRRLASLRRPHQTVRLTIPESPLRLANLSPPRKNRAVLCHPCCDASQPGSCTTGSGE